MNTPSEPEIIQAIEKWVDSFIVGLNLCPFAKRELDNNRIRFCVSAATEEEDLLFSLNDELNFLLAQKNCETTLLIVPYLLGDFYEFNSFLELAHRLLSQSGLEGIFQIASFHPDYQFLDTTVDDVTNFTNRSPYPVLHLLRESSVGRAVSIHPDIDSIPTHNMNLMQRMGQQKLEYLLRACIKKTKRL